jgi:hypothetical protein
MAISVGDIVQITDVQSFLGQTLLNVYFYELMSKEAAVDLVDLTNAHQLLVQDVVKTIQSTLLTHTLTQAKNLTDGLSIFDDPIVKAGTRGGDGTPSFTAASFRLNRTNAATRHGSKRIGGLSETDIEGNSVAAASVVNFTAVSAALEADLFAAGTLENDFVARPVILGRFHLGDPNVGEIDLSVVNPVDTVQFIRLTTQTTRRAGRGI